MDVCLFFCFSKPRENNSFSLSFSALEPVDLVLDHRFTERVLAH